MGIPFIISAPSGAGKTSLVKALVQDLPAMTVSISHTTRAIRPGEENGVNYYFVSQAEFQQLIAQNAFLESAEVFGHYYGTAQANLMQRLQQGKDVILEIDWQGAALVRAKLPQAVSIFILPPSLEILMQRLQNRKQDSEAVIEERMQQAKNEISHFAEFDYVVVNDDFATALADLKSIVQANHLRTKIQQQELGNLLQNLLG